jgi:hypothetical protein
MKYKKTIIAVSTVAVVSLAGYWFFFKTLRGNSLALYAVGGWNAPLSIRYNCGKQTDAAVYEKFLRPLKFDEPTKDLLKNFWYYSYYRDCLYKHGYDFKGNPVPKSSIVVAGATAVYSNNNAGFTFTVPPETTITTDNALDVDFDDYLLASTLQTKNGLIQVHYYTKITQYENFDVLNEKFQSIPTTNGKVVSKTIAQIKDGTKDLHVTQDDGNRGFVAQTAAGHVIVVFGQEAVQDAITSIENSLQMLK